MLKAKNSSLNRAGIAKDDEFYTTYDAIQTELNHYEDKFRGKVIFCNWIENNISFMILIF